MGDDCVVISESDIFALKETLYEQQQLLQKLYNELDAEREASATAANEALSVILRLQSEKATIKMESEQYKRMSEHKICHAEESLAIIEDITYQKEMEVAALEHQLQSYRCKLLSLGCVDAEMRFSDNGFQRSEDLGGETSLKSLIRRSRSFSLPLNYDNKVLVDEQTGKNMFNRALDSDKKISNTLSGDDIQSYWEQIRKLGNRVKEIAGANGANSRSETRSVSSVSSQIGAGNLGDLSNFRNRARSPSPHMTPYNLTDSNPLSVVNETEEPKCSPNSMKNEAARDHPSSSSVHDVFEVPQADQSFTSHRSKSTCCNNNGSGKSGVIHPEEADELLPHAMKSSPNWLRKKVPRPARYKRKLGKRNRTSFFDHSRFPTMHPGTCSATESLPVWRQLNVTSEITEVQSPSLEESTKREEELKLLHEIREQLNSLQKEVQSWKEKKKPHSREEGVSLHSLQEAMLHFWL